MDNYYYVDKTEYIKKLEDYPNKRVMFLRPRKFGETYIGKNPTNTRNSYHILKFNFSGIDTSNVGSTMHGFKESVQLSINSLVNNYGLYFYVNPELTTEGLLSSVFEAFKFQKTRKKYM